MYELSFFTSTSLSYEDQSVHNFVRKMKLFKSRITLEAGSRAANAKSLMGLLAMELKPGIRVTAIAEGEDEKEAVEMVKSLLSPETDPEQ